MHVNTNGQFHSAQEGRKVVLPVKVSTYTGQNRTDETQALLYNVMEIFYEKL